MPLTTTGRNDLLTNGTTNFAYASAMTDLGTTEASGVTRQAITLNAASSGARTNSAQITIPIGAGNTVQVGSIHSAVTAGNVEGWFQIGSTVRGTCSVAASTDLFTSNGHGLTTDDRVFFTTIAGEAIPTGISTTTLYFVLASGLTTAAFKVSTTSGGTALDVTADGEAAFFKTVPQPFPSGGNLVIASGALTIDAAFA
jgi:hypothetical protein